MDSGNLELARLQEGEMRAVDRTREMEGAGREKEKGWTEGGRGGERRVLGDLGKCEWRRGKHIVLIGRLQKARSLMGPV